MGIPGKKGLNQCNSVCRSSRSKVFCKKDISKNFAKFTGKQLCQSFFFNKVAGHFIKKIDSGTGVFL